MKPTVIVASTFSPTFTTALLKPLSSHADLEVVPYPGVAGNPGFFTPETAVEAIVACAHRIRQRNALPPMYVFGYSMGGYFAMQATVEMGPPVNGLLLAAPLVSRQEAEQTANARGLTLWTLLEKWIGRQADAGLFLDAFFQTPLDRDGSHWARRVKCHTFAVQPLHDELITARHYEILATALAQRFEQADLPANHFFQGAVSQLNALLANYLQRSMATQKWWHRAPPGTPGAAP